jgi:signal peptidase I
MKKRSLTTKNLFDKKPGKLVKFASDAFKELIGTEAELKGCWLIYGPEKNGKTWLSLRLAKDLAVNHKITYISAEEGMDVSFKLACKRAGITRGDKILFDEYIPVPELIDKFQKQKSSEVIIIDNLLIYKDDFRYLRIIDFLAQLSNKLVIFIGHEERKEPYPSVAREAKKVCKAYIHVLGLRAFIVSRYSKGGYVDIDMEKAELYWGSELEETKKE